MFRCLLRLALLLMQLSIRCRSLSTFGVVLVGVYLPASVAESAETVTQMFVRAQKHFYDGNNKASVQVLRQIVRRYPDHQPSHLLLGRIAFQLGKMGPALRHFKRVPLDLIGPEVAYEYGMAFFVAKEFAVAVKALGKVPGRSREADVAAFYRGICFMRLNQWQQAQQMMNRAKRLPENLEPAKRDALEAIQQRLRMQQNGGGMTPAPYIPTPVPPPATYDSYAAGPPPGSDKSVSEKAAPKNAAKAEAPKTGSSHSVSSSFSYAETAMQDDMHGYETRNYEKSVTTVGVTFNARYDAQPRSGGGQPYANLKLDLNEMLKDSNGTSVKYVAYQNDPGAIQEQQTETPASFYKEANVGLKPEVGYPLSDSIDGKLIYNYTATLPYVEAAKKNTIAGPELKLGAGFSGLTSSLSGGQTNYVDNKGVTTKVNVYFKGEASKSFDTLTVAGNVSQTDSSAPGIDKPNPSQKQVMELSSSKTWNSVSATATVNNTNWGFVPGKFATIADDAVPTQALRIQLGLTKTFEFASSSLTGTLAQVRQSQIKMQFDDASKPADANGVAAKKVVKADNTINDTSLAFSLAPLDWLSLSTKFQYIKNNYAIGDAAITQPWQQAFPETSTIFNLTITLTKTF